MKPNDNSDPKAMSMIQLINELHRAKANEKWLMDQNKEQKRKLCTLVTAEISLKKEQLEVARLNNKTIEQDLHVERLRKALEKVKTNLRNEETRRAHEKTISDQRIVGLEKDRLEFQNKFSLEKMLREQKEKELEKFSNTKGEIKKLTLHGQTLHHQVQELTGYKNYATKKLEEQIQQLKKKDMEHDQTKQELNKIRQTARHYKDMAEKLILHKDRYEMVQKVAEKQANELKKYQKQADIHKNQIHDLTKETMTMTRKVEDLVVLKKILENQVDQRQHDNNLMTVEIENHKKEAEKQRNLMLNLESELNNYNDLKSKLQNKDKEISRHTMARDQEIINLRNLISESERLQRMQIIQIEAVKAERSVIYEHLLKARAELSLKNKIIKQMNDEIKDQNCEINTKNVELFKIKTEYCSVKNHLEKVKRQLAESKITQEICTESSDKDKILLEKKLAMKAAEKDKLEKELQHYNELVVQQQQKINIQEAAKVTQEHTLKEYLEEIKFLRLENERLEHKHYIMEKKLLRQAHLQVKSRRERVRVTKKNLHPCLKMMYNQHREYHFFGKLQLLEEKDKKIEELMRMLARRPDNVIQKLQMCQWHNRQLNKTFMASQGLLMAYKAKFKSVKDENKRLTDELRKLKLECAEKSRYTHLPPFSNTSQSPSGNKSKDQCESGHTSKRTRFPHISTKSQCQSKNKCEIAPQLPVYNMVQCCGRQIRPHPPAPRSLEVSDASGRKKNQNVVPAL